MRTVDRIDTSYRNKDYTMAVSISTIPPDEKEMEAALLLPVLAMERDDVSILARLPEEGLEDALPQSIMISGARDGIYMELTYSKGGAGRKGPKILAHDHLSIEEANGVLASILAGCTDDIPMITREFADVSARLNPAGDEEGSDDC